MAYIPTHVTQEDGSLCQMEELLGGRWCLARRWSHAGRHTSDAEAFRGHSKQAGDDCTTGGLGSISTGMLTLGIAVRRWNDVSLEEGLGR